MQQLLELRIVFHHLVGEAGRLRAHHRVWSEVWACASSKGLPSSTGARVWSTTAEASCYSLLDESGMDSRSSAAPLNAVNVSPEQLPELVEGCS
ncbi:hypothetical protein LTS63_06525 [Mycobacterium intracellulare]|uniref:hypothetical protein n=1 Tax=Mycobacterium intracellulare TaxID=1767 RepID=UPI001E34A138|nr:hypothetical protein [Mycobacterium intracellulare]UGU03379.1 hypothetical protein LTS63_06525 [Mycobacterium intracellulare]